MTDSVQVSVVIPTLGRPRLLAECLRSLERCAPQAAEVVVVDQSRDTAVAELVASFSGTRARLVPVARPNVARARNEGLRHAECDVVLFTDDDCTVAESWVGVGWRLMKADSDRIVTGRVLPGGPDVPSIRESEERHDHTGELQCGVLDSNNLLVPRPALLDFGAFDERLAVAAEDNDLCYRWLRAGRRLWYEPDLVVWHQAWRAPEELARTYDNYWRGQGVFYAKHLRRGDINVLRLLGGDVNGGLRALAAEKLRRRRRSWSAPRLRPLAAGLVRGPRAPERG